MKARLALVLIAAAAFLVPTRPAWVEHGYSRTLYPRLQDAITPFSNRVPFALLDPLLAAALVLFVVAIVRLVRAMRRGARLRALGRFLLGLATAAAGIYLVFLLLWGLNYRRQPLGAKLDFREARVTPLAILELAETSLTEVNALHDAAHAAGWPALEGMPDHLASAFSRALDTVAPSRVAPGVPKWSVLMPFFARAGVEGVTDPFFLEVIVNREVLPFERPFTVAHEWAHLAGYADEAEASFFGWLTCVQGTAADRYSGWLYLYSQSVDSLPRDSRARLMSRLAPRPRRDLGAIAARLARISRPLSQASWRIYDEYLKGNRVAAGVRSYDAVVTLVAGTTFRPGWIPLLRAAP